MRLAGLLLAGSFAVLSGCSDSTGPEDVIGVYNLLTINGELLPFTTLESTSLRQAATTGGLRIGVDDDWNREEGKFSEFVSIHTYAKPSGAVSGEQFVSESGTYVLSGRTLTLTFPGRSPPNRTIVATVDGDRITYRTPNNLIVVYQKFNI
jgi:hypothetical protein